MDLEVDQANVAASSVESHYTSILEQKAETVMFDVKNIVKNVPHIPYILNGQLYEIQTQDGENVTVRCCHCPPDRVYRGSVRSTGNFHMHIKRRHPDLLGKLHDMKVNALLERRDRLMRNRKVTTYRRNRGTNRSRNHQHQTLDDASSSNTVHKLKIKSAFQRHQFQFQQQQEQKQRQLDTMHHWAAAQPLVVSIGNASSVPEVQEPINYSIKSNNSTPYNLVGCNVSRSEDEPAENDFLSMQLPPPSTQSQPQSLVTITEIQQQTREAFTMNENSQNYDRVSDATPCPSTLSSYGSNISVGNSQFNPISVVKDELLMPEKAIDLTMNISTLSSSSGIGSAGTSATNESSFESNNAADSFLPNINWIELFQRFETSLRDIQLEMRTRNQIETNRMFLDIAKFKYLHPGFNYQC